MRSYKTELQISLDNTTELLVLNVSENRKNINRLIIPEKQLTAIELHKSEFESDKRLLARSFLYEYMSKKYNLESFELVHNNFHKLFFKQRSDLHFSFSYAGDYVVIGISRGRELGVDIEFIDKSLDVELLAYEIMCPEELKTFAALSGEAFKRSYFFQVFSCKESIVKAFGNGLYFDVRDLNTLADGVYTHGETRFRPLLSQLWRGEYFLSVCRQTLE